MELFFFKPSRSMIDLTNQKFGRLTILSLAGRTANRKIAWHCRCECGTAVIVRTNSLKTGNTTSCGCVSSDVTADRNRTHGKAGTPTYISWKAMKTRCCNATNPSFAYYGGRGISICDRWKESFEAFVEDMGERPEGTSIDRIDSNGNYEPSNCRWATDQEQANNRRLRRSDKGKRRKTTLERIERKINVT